MADDIVNRLHQKIPHLGYGGEVFRFTILRHFPPDDWFPLYLTSVNGKNAVNNAVKRLGPKLKLLTTHWHYTLRAKRVERSYNRRSCELLAIGYTLWYMIRSLGGKKCYTATGLCLVFGSRANDTGMEEASQYDFVVSKPKYGNQTRSHLCPPWDGTGAWRIWELRSKGYMLRVATTLEKSIHISVSLLLSFLMSGFWDFESKENLDPYDDK